MNLRKKEDIYKSNKQQQQQRQQPEFNSIEQCVIITRLVTYFILFVCITIRFCSTSFHVPNQLQMNSCLFFSESIISIRIYCRQSFFFVSLSLSVFIFAYYIENFITTNFKQVFKVQICQKKREIKRQKNLLNNACNNKPKTNTLTKKNIYTKLTDSNWWIIA